MCLCCLHLECAAARDEVRVAALLAVHQAEVDDGADIDLSAEHGKAATISAAFGGDLHELAVAEHAAHEDNAVVDIGHAGGQRNFPEGFKSEGRDRARFADVNLETLELALGVADKVSVHAVREPVNDMRVTLLVSSSTACGRGRVVLAAVCALFNNCGAVDDAGFHG